MTPSCSYDAVPMPELPENPKLATPGGTRTSPASSFWAALVCAMLVLAILAVYGPVFRFDFTNYDDPDYVTNNPPVRAGLRWTGIQWAFTHSHSANWHPLTWISHMCDCSLFGLRAGGHHITNLLL